jgi:hypothetical protein
MQDGPYNDIHLMFAMNQSLVNCSFKHEFTGMSRF